MKMMTKEFIYGVIEDFFGPQEFGELYGPDFEYEEQDVVGKIDDHDGVSFETEGNFYFDGHRYTISLGASKMVFIFDDFDEVIKVPLVGKWFYIDDAYDDEDYAEDDKFDFREFSNDYFIIENEIYEEASDALKQIIAPNVYQGEYGCFSIYTQEKVDKIFGRIRSEELSLDAVPADTRRKAEKLGRKASLNARFVADILMHFPDGETIVSEINFDDLHTSNYGYFSDQRPVIFDYAGFWD